MPTVSLSGLEFEFQKNKHSSLWIGKRPFPFLPVPGGVDKKDLPRVVLEGRNVTDVQKRALESFLGDEVSICESLLQTVLRYVRSERKQESEQFDDIPAIRSARQLGKVLGFESLTVMQQAHDGESLLGFAFHCDWDEEHGFGVAIHRGQVIDMGDADVSFSPSGVAVQMCQNGVFTDKQLAASKAVFGKKQADGVAALAAKLDARREQEDQKRRDALANPAVGPAVKQFVRLVENEVCRTMRITLDIPAESVTPLYGELPQRIQQVQTSSASAKSGRGQKAKELKSIDAILAQARQNALSKLAEPPSPVIRALFMLGDDRAYWNYLSHENDPQKLQNDGWPDVLYALARRWPGAKPRFDSVVVTMVNAKKVRGTTVYESTDTPDLDTPVLPAAVAAIAEIFGVDSPKGGATKNLKQSFEKRQAAALADLRGGPGGMARWNARPESERRELVAMGKYDLSNTWLDGANFSKLELKGFCFDGAQMKDVNLYLTQAPKCSFRKARIETESTNAVNLRGADFRGTDLGGSYIGIANLTKADFRDADLSRATISFCDIRGADFSTATLGPKTFVGQCSFDGETKFPEDFVLPGEKALLWKGRGNDPRKSKRGK